MKKNTKRNLMLLLVGIVSGLVNGVFGAGGGLIIVPMLKKFNGQNLDSKTIHATTLGCVMFMCLVSSIVYFVEKKFNFQLILWCTIGSLIGSFFATKLLKNLKNNYIDLIFAIVLMIAGISLIFF